MAVINVKKCKGIYKGLNWTQEELNVQRNRWGNTFYNLGDAGFTNSPQDGAQIFPRAEIFAPANNLSAWEAEKYIAYPGIAPIPAQNDEDSKAASPDDFVNYLCAAYLFAITQNERYSDAVKNRQLWQAAEPTTNPLDNAKYPSDQWRANNPSFYFAANLRREIMADEYVWDTYSANQKQTRNEYIMRWGRYFLNKNTLPAMNAVWESSTTRRLQRQNYLGRNKARPVNNHHYYTLQAPSTPINGTVVREPQKDVSNNRMTMNFLGMVSAAIHLIKFPTDINPANVGLSTDAEVQAEINAMIQYYNVYTEEFIKFGMLTNGLASDMERFMDHSAQAIATKRLQHEKGARYYANCLSNLIEGHLDLLRAGLPHRLDYTTTEGFIGYSSDGVTAKSLDLGVEALAKIMNKEVVWYGISDGAEMNANTLIDFKTPTDGNRVDKHFAWFWHYNMFKKSERYRKIIIAHADFPNVDAWTTNPGASGTHQWREMGHGIEVACGLKFGLMEDNPANPF